MGSRELTVVGQLSAMVLERLRAKALENAGFLKICLALVVLEVLIIVPMWAAGAHGDRNIWLFFSIPLISGLVGYTTNVLALIMTFAPLEFTGIPVLLIPNEPVGLFGWQGIIPAKAGKMAAISVDLMLEKLFDVREIFEKLDPRRVSALLEPGLMEITKRVVDTVAMEHAPALWREVPPPLKAEVLRTSRDAAPAMIHGMLDEMKDRILEVLDVRTMAIRHLELHKELLIDMFQKCGKEEFIFIEQVRVLCSPLTHLCFIVLLLTRDPLLYLWTTRATDIEQSGFYFGFSFGLLQVLLTY